MSATARMLRPFLARQWKALVGAGGATAGVTLADLAKPWPIALVIDELFAGRSGSFDLSAADTRLLAIIAGLVVVIAMLDAASTYLADLWLQRAGERINHELRVAVYSHLQRLSLGYHQRRQKGDLVTRVTGDVNAVGALFADALGPMAQAVLMLAGVFVVTLVLDPLLALVTFSAVPLLALVSFRYRRKLRAAARRQRLHEGEIASLADEALSAMPVVKAFGSERFEHGRVEERSELRMALGVEVARLQARFDGLIGVLTAAGTALVIVIGVLRVASGAISPGDLVVFAQYTRRIHSPLRAIARYSAKMQKGLARADRIADVLAEDEVIEERPGTYRGPRAAGEVVLENVTFGYDPDRPVLRDVSLRVAPGECVALVGPSGVGKSTLGALVARFFDPQEGRVMLDGRDLRDCSVAWLREQVGVLLQDTMLFSGTVADNIAYASEADRERVVEAARTAAAHDFIGELPGGYDAELGPQGGGLSGGQRQRIGIARTLLRDPPVLVLDEPTTGLDADSKEQVLNGLFRLIEGRTTILITHSPELAARADRVITASGSAPIAAPVSAPRVPRDPGLPMEALLDGGRMARVLERSLGRAGEVGEVQIARVRWKPGRRLVVHYRARVDGEHHDAVATALAGEDLRAHARRPAWAEAARVVNGRSPAVTPLAFDDDVDALVTWLPLDVALPALTAPSDDLPRRLAEAGIDPGGSEPRLVGYKPGSRAVLRLGPHVLKGYGSRRQFEAALAGLRASAGALPAPAFEAALPELRATVQEAVEGSSPPDAVAAAGLAAGLAREVRGAVSGAGLPLAPPQQQLAEARRHAALACALLPEEEARIERLLRALDASAPRLTPLAPAHGDFHVDQLLVERGVPRIVDFDDMCLAPAALDLATYAADVVRGRPEDKASLTAVVRPLLAAYGDEPPGFQWYLATAVLCRCTHAFRVFAPDWPERVEGTLSVAEGLAAR